MFSTEVKNFKHEFLLRKFNKLNGYYKEKELGIVIKQC